MKKITIIVPVYNEGLNLIIFFERLIRIVKKIKGYKFDYFFVNDGSTDNSWKVISSLSKNNKNVRAINFTRNFGKEIALSAGVNNSLDSDAIITLDSDLQHPPELIPKMIRGWIKGNDIIVAVRTSNRDNNFFRMIGSKFFYWILNRFSDLTILPNSTDFRLFNKKVSYTFSLMSEKERLFRGIIDWTGYKTDYVHFDANSRIRGRSSYSYYSLFNLAIRSITSFSLWPLKLVGYLGLVICLSCFLIFLWMSFKFLMLGFLPYTPLALFTVFNTLLIGIVLSALGLVALYIGIIHTEVINRPLYIIDKKINFE